MRKILTPENFNPLYEQGLDDSAIGRILGCHNATVTLYRKRHNISKNHQYVRRFTEKAFLEQYEKGMTDTAIAKTLGVGHRSITEFRNSLKLPVYTFYAPLTKEQEEMLLGIMLGDGSLKRVKYTKHTAGSIAHGPKQFDYNEHIYEKLKNLCASPPKVGVAKTPKDNSRYKQAEYFKSTLYIRANKALDWMYDNMYIQGVKRITKPVMDKFTPCSLAYLFMDDGCKNNSGGHSISTNCFPPEDIRLLQNKLEEWGLKTSVHKSNVLYISATSTTLFKELVTPYLLETMHYKLN